jgi:hypothetical protein
MRFKNEDTVQIMKRFDRLDAKLNSLHKALRTQHWVKFSIIKAVTGWDSRFMQKARDNGLVKTRVGVSGIEYLLESIPEMFIINKKL